MKKATKLIALVLCALMLVTSFAACTSTPEEGTPEEITVVLGVYPDEADADSVALHEGYVSTFEADENHANVTLVKQHYEYALDTFASLAEAGTVPTVFEPWFTEPQKLINNGYVADITDNLAARGWDEALTDAMKDLLSDEDGRIYGLPRDSYALGLMINVDLFKAAGLVDENGYPLFPKTLQEMAEYAQKIKQETGKAGLCLLAQDNAGGWHFSNIAWNFGAKDFATYADGKYTAHLDQDACIKAMEYVWSLKWEYDCLTDDPTVENWGTGFVQLGTGEAAMYIAANDAVGQPTAYQASLSKDSLAMCAVPAGPNGDQYALIGGTTYMFSNTASSAEIDAALDYLDIMGRGPVMSSGREDDFKYRVENNIPVIRSFPLWDSADYTAAEEALVEKYSNVDTKMFDGYLDFIANGNLRSEGVGDPQKGYEMLVPVMQEVLTNKDSFDNIPALMAEANANYQAVLDNMVA